MVYHVVVILLTLDHWISGPRAGSSTRARLSISICVANDVFPWVDLGLREYWNCLIVLLEPDTDWAWVMAATHYVCINEWTRQKLWIVIAENIKTIG